MDHLAIGIAGLAEPRRGLKNVCGLVEVGVPHGEIDVCVLWRNARSPFQ